MVIRVPEKQLFRWPRMVVAGVARLDGIAKNVMTADSFIPAVDDIATPFANENTFGCAGFVATVGIHLAPTFCRPTDNLDFKIARGIDQASVTAQRFIRRRHHRDGDAFHVGRNIRIQIIGRIHEHSREFEILVLIRAEALAAAARRQRLPDADLGAGEDIGDLRDG